MAPSNASRGHCEVLLGSAKCLGSTGYTTGSARTLGIILQSRLGMVASAASRSKRSMLAKIEEATTAISMRAFIYYLLRNPQCKRKLVEEIDSKRKAGELSDPVKLAEAEKMEYLQAVILEALRCHPAVGMSLPRVVPADGLQVGDRFLKKGTVVGANPWAVHTLEDVFGPGTAEFRPERWLKEDTGDMRKAVSQIYISY